MKNELIFWAQALDNSSPDHIEMRGEKISDGDSLRREEGVSLISNVVKSGSRIFESHGMHLTADQKHFVIEVPSIQLDQLGRTSPVVCCGDYDTSVSDEFAGKVASGFEAFAKCIGRSLQLDRSKLSLAFEELKKKGTRRRLLCLVWIGVAVVILLVYWLGSRK